MHVYASITLHVGYTVDSPLSNCYNSGNILSTSLSVILSVTILIALVSLIATVIVCYKKNRSSKSDEPVEPVYYSAVRSVAEEGTTDPTYDVISAAVKTRRDITTEPNEAYHPVSVCNPTTPTKQTSCMLISLTCRLDFLYI